jgi:hypothetical protein
VSERVASAISPFCARLRSKKFYFLRTPPREVSDILDGSGRCWCQRTMDALGPDGRPVDPEDCQNGRRCYESFGADPSQRKPTC